MKYLSSHALDKPESYSEPKTVTLEALEATHRYDDIEPNVLLTHAGYLSIREVQRNGLVTLGYPNREVAGSMASLYAEHLLGGKLLSAPECAEIEKVLERGVLADVVQELNRVFQAVDYQNYPVSSEAACRAYVQVLLIGASLSPAIEVHSARGRSDLEVTAGDWHWVFEFKFAEKPGAVRRMLDEGIRQMRERAYGAAPKGKTLRRAVLVFSAESRSFAAWQDAEAEA